MIEMVSIEANQLLFWYRNYYRIPLHSPLLEKTTDFEIEKEFEKVLYSSGATLKECPKCGYKTYQKYCPRCREKGEIVELVGDKEFTELYKKIVEKGKGFKPNAKKWKDIE